MRAYMYTYIYIYLSSIVSGLQDYITARVASVLGIDLTALDPDGIGEEGGMFRLNVFGAALPTLFGVWWDTWKVYMSENPIKMDDDSGYHHFWKPPYLESMRKSSINDFFVENHRMTFEERFGVFMS